MHFRNSISGVCTYKTGETLFSRGGTMPHRPSGPSATAGGPRGKSGRDDGRIRSAAALSAAPVPVARPSALHWPSLQSSHRACCWGAAAGGAGSEGRASSRALGGCRPLCPRGQWSAASHRVLLARWHGESQFPGASCCTLVLLGALVDRFDPIRGGGGAIVAQLVKQRPPPCCVEAGPTGSKGGQT